MWCKKYKDTVFLVDVSTDWLVAYVQELEKPKKPERNQASVQLYVYLFWWCKKCNLKCFRDFSNKTFYQRYKMFHLPYTIHLVQGTGHPSFSYSTWFVQVTDCHFFEFIVSMGISITSRKRVCQSYSNYKCNFCINPIKGTLFKSWLKMLGKVKKKALSSDLKLDKKRK